MTRGNYNEYEIWKTRVNQCLGFYVMYDNNGTISEQAVIGMFEGFTFVEIANVMKKKYPDSPLPKGWKNDIDNKINIGYAPPDMLSQIQKERIPIASVGNN